MFRAPKVTLSLNLGYGIPKAGSDIFSEAFDTYTLAKGDFRAPIIGGGLSFFLNERVDLAVEFSYSRSNTWSEYIDWVEDNDVPIEQRTRLTRAPLTLSARYFLKDRGRRVGSLSWIPTTWSPYIGAGGGRMFYEFEQVGDFVDFADLSIFTARFLSEGWAWVGHVFGGLQWSLSPQWVVTAEARYSLADADLNRPDFSGYEPIDLSGFNGSVGFGIRF
jgi:opacity protein-like surface antigen